MATAELPWEASRPMLDWLRFLRDAGENLPTIELAKWFWVITLAAPELPIKERDSLAGFLAMSNKENDPNAIAKRSAELYLICTPWRSKEDKAAYQEMRRNGRFISVPTDLRDAFRAAEEVARSLETGEFDRRLEKRYGPMIRRLEKRLGRAPNFNEAMAEEKRSGRKHNAKKR
jgi:hypothetical protein